ncbi:hypothetical protein DH2020_027459 [Rehmannia glutinosa]|uniref:F-box associated beta-propeller type 3 domain-containing protein n=1 Tax=Rehmannia glutinosa TaxID=99300 RepID=A0ABR0VX08_REHGL
MLNCCGNPKHFSVNSLLHEPLIDAFDTDYSVPFSKKLVCIVGCCDCLICLAVGQKDLFLLNPSTRICKKLSDFGEDINFGCFSYVLGFGKTSDDYKVVGFSNFSEIIVKVYSLKSDQWKRIEDFKGSRLMDDPAIAIFADGKLHGIAISELESESGWEIFSLDLETEEYGILPMPNYVLSVFWPRLGTYDGCLYVLCNHPIGADVWIIDDNGVGKETWTKVVTIPYIFDDFSIHIYKKVLYVLKNGEVLLLCGLKLVIFDAKD